MKYRCACGDEYFIFDGTTNHMSVWPNEAIASDSQRVTRSAAEYCVFHDDALSSDRNGPTLCDDLRTVHDAAAWSDRDVSAHNCIWRYPCCWVDLRRNAVMFDKQIVLLGWT